jgi:hypothetical protein
MSVKFDHYCTACLLVDGHEAFGILLVHQGLIVSERHFDSEEDFRALLTSLRWSNIRIDEEVQEMRVRATKHADVHAVAIEDRT